MTLPLINYDEVVNAFDPSDEGYSACTVAASFVAGCVAELGGSEALSTANPLKFAACVCCVGTTDVAPVYSTCSDYLSSGAPDLDSQISGVGGPAETSRVTAEGSTVDSTGASATGGGASGSASRTASGTAPSPTLTYDIACEQMVGLYGECASATPAFSRLPYGEQAYCYCCRTAIDGSHVTWTDEFDSYAKTCRDWAVTKDKADYDDVYSLAKNFATFCDHFSDACDMPTTTSPFTPTATDDETGSPTTGDPATGTVDEAATATSTDAAPTAGIGLAAGVLALAGFVVMM
ncbi:uncharacterized protein TRIREDRAFT_80026 [Trichoderma reesei QM6a]|uniref:Predicted protein n=1 Tax=Hypocrea jecorina (strain QM6a) TaxID=431241 RepID=G0RPN5_HYPJQ|nr:uncharacterized protein TRIREDRAFT_80026 [Trichoderma reesei QM6a]EGR46888.1 predicted protein [Trichoderma reesei QM6a]